MTEYETLAAQIPDYNLDGEAYDTHAVERSVNENAARGMDRAHALEQAAREFSLTEEAVSAILQVADLDRF